MQRPTNKQLFDAIEERVRPMPYVEASDPTGALIAYAQLRAFERIADNLHGIMEVLAVIRDDHKPEPTELIEALKFADDTLEDLRVPGGEGNRFEQAIPATLAKIRAALGSDAAKAVDAKGEK